jgi:hypothetical protein
MFQLMPWLTPADRPLAKSWAQLEYLADLLFVELKTKGVFNQSGETRRLLHDLRQLRLAQLSMAVQLGMTPTARATFRLGKSDGFDLPAAFSQIDAVEK